MYDLAMTIYFGMYERDDDDQLLPFFWGPDSIMMLPYMASEMCATGNFFARMVGINLQHHDARLREGRLEGRVDQADDALPRRHDTVRYTAHDGQRRLSRPWVWMLPDRHQHRTGWLGLH